MNFLGKCKIFIFNFFHKMVDNEKKEILINIRMILKAKDLISIKSDVIISDFSMEKLLPVIEECNFLVRKKLHAIKEELEKDLDMYY